MCNSLSKQTKRKNRKGSKSKFSYFRKCFELAEEIPIDIAIVLQLS